MKKELLFGMTAVLGMTLGFWGCQRSPIPTTPKSTPTPSFTPTPNLTLSATATATPSSTATTTSSFSPTPTPSATRTSTPSPSATPSSTATSTPSSSPSPTPTSTSSSSPTPSYSVTATLTPSPTATPTATASSTASPTSTATPTPNGFCGSVFGAPGTPVAPAGAEHLSNNTAGVTTSHIAAAPYSLPADGLVTSLSGIFPITTPSPITSGEVRLALYSDASGSPGSLLAEATPVPYVNGQSFYTALVPPTNLAAGTYWLAAQSAGTGILVNSGGMTWCDMFLGLTSQTGSGVDENWTYGPFPSTMAPTSSTGYTYQLWANYCPDTPTPTPTP